MIYKAMFDTKTPTWQAFGRAVFFDSDDPDPLELQRLAIIEAQKEYPGATIYVVGVGQSTRAAWDGFLEKKRQLREWQERVTAGVPNHPSDLQSGTPTQGFYIRMPAKAAAIFAELERKPALLEDRREYCVDDLRGAYGLNDEDAAALYLRIREVFRPEGATR